MGSNINTVLDKRKINFSEASLVDDFGRVFFYEGRVFRAIYTNQNEHCLELLESGLFEELFSKQYIPHTWITDYQLEGYGVILEHEFIDESKPHHWSFSMYKDAALLILEINRICNAHGYELKDAHPFNVFFKKNNPIFIDIGSISKRKDPNSWVPYEEFITSFYIQLLLWSKSEFFLTRKLIEDGNSPVLRTIPMSNILDSAIIDNIAQEVFDFKLLFRGKLIHNAEKADSVVLAISRTMNDIGSLVIRRQVKSFTIVKQLKSKTYIETKIKNIERPVDKSYWGGYHETYKSGNTINSTPRFDRILQLISEKATDIKSATDLAGNQGVFCYLLSKKIGLDRVVLTDYDEKAIDTAYEYFKTNEINIQPYLFNFMIPLRKEEKNFLKSDIVFALAITHHLILTQKYSLYAIFNRIADFSNKYVAIEFMPVGLWGGEDTFPEVPDWYNVDWFRVEFQKHFELIVEEKLEVNRIVFFGRKF